jgi:membrane protein implicated in regulation of membrane protease activity
VSLPLFGKRSPRTFARYLALEAPGWVLSAWLLWLLVEKAGLAPWLGGLLWTLWVAKDFALYPRLRDAYEVGEPDATAPLLGRIGLARQRLDPTGYVRIGAELWRAELAPGSAAIEPGSRVRVRAVRGLTLVVEACEQG